MELKEILSDPGVQYVLTGLAGAIIGFVVLMIIYRLIFKEAKFWELILLSISTEFLGIFAPLIYYAIKHRNDPEDYSNYTNTPTGSGKIKKAYTDTWGNTSYRDENGKLLAKSYTDSMGSTTFRDAEGNKIGSAYTDAMGRTSYYDNDGNKTGSSYTDSWGSTSYSDGGSSYTDSFGSTTFYDD